MSFRKILDKYRKISFSERDKGDRFERLMQAFLQTDPKYAYQLKNVWMWNDFPARQDFGGKDIGIDIVALTHTGDYWAIQCKFFAEGSLIDKGALDSFLSTSSKQFKAVDTLQTVGFSQRLWISTTNKWGTTAQEIVKNQNPPFTRINFSELENAPVDWDKLAQGLVGEQSRDKKKELYPHQVEALENTHEYFKSHDRGQMIMACGTGKTFTSLRIAENETNGKGLVLFLVPSIALLGQTLNAWTADAKEPINPICICSDPKVSKRQLKNEDIDTFSVVDLALPASTNVTTINKQFNAFKHLESKGMTVVFSTYQSIDVIAEAQEELLKHDHSGNPYGVFDLIICDEAHRTTGVTLSGNDESAFVKVHDNDFLKAKKRLYMTATPRLYSDDSKSKAAQYDAVLCSMDDDKVFGEEIYRIGFGEAVEHDLLSDYKVLILTMSDKDIPKEVQKAIANEESEINYDDASKLIGVINALSKQVLGDEGIIKKTDPDPMQRGVAFCQNIKISKATTRLFNDTTDIYLDSLGQETKNKMVSVDAKHIDGTMSAPERDELLNWLKSDNGESNECKILTNVRCLSEGVDVPSLDSVLFLSARNSQVDVVQSVGRVMRKAPNKKYGYIIIPIVIPSDVEASKALDDNKRYQVVWSVLNALRAHDDRFNATVNKIELNKKRPTQIIVGSPYGFGGGAGAGAEDGESTYGEINRQLAMQFEQLQSVVFAKMVNKVGDRRYWEQWAKNVAEIAERQIDRITNLIDNEGTHRKAFDDFLDGLQKNINPSITKTDAIEMLSQHIITKPVFEALFEGYSFVKNNPISVSMQTMLELLEAQAIEKDTETLNRFYESVRTRAEGIDNAEGKQRIIIELYDKFFKTAFPKMVEQLGIVYTPVEVVDFIIHSVNDVLKKEFGRSISDENIHILDPFTGTGTFITRLLQSGLIEQKDLDRKYAYELHANEIVLLAYYIAAVNIENTYHDIIGKDSDYKPFDGIVLTDTFQMGETGESEQLFSEMFPQNSERVKAQKKSPIKVIVGNPPYSKGQKSANDDAQNQGYEKLDARIAETYVKESVATNSNAVYDSYIKAFRWSTDRLDPENGGIIAFVSNSTWLDGNSTDGFRKSIEKEFNTIYVFNLRGNQRTSGELSRQEGGKIFGSGSRTPIAITLLVKNPKTRNKKVTIHYYDIGDYLSREEKLEIVKNFNSISTKELNWKNLHPNKSGDWLNQRNDEFNNFIPLVPDKKFNINSKSFFVLNTNGNQTARDSWCYNSSFNTVSLKMKELIDYYNGQNEDFKIKKERNPKLEAEDFIDTNPLRISWTRGLKNALKNFKEYNFSNNSIVKSMYRPFTKQHLYFSKDLNEYVFQQPKLFPKKGIENVVICTSGAGGNKENSTIMSNIIADLNILDASSQNFPLYYYEERKKENPTLFDETGDSEYIKRDGVSNFILEQAKKIYGKNISKEDIFYYVYGILHSPDYRKTFTNDLKKMLPRIPLVDSPKDFWKFSKAGRALADLHINYESVDPYPDVNVIGAESEFYKVEKMRFPKKDQKETIIYNSKIVIEDIPAKAYEYVVNGKSAIDWIMERYQVTVHKDSGIRNDPNDWSDEVGNPRYILDLLLSIINVSVQTVDIVYDLPKLEFE